MLSIKVLLSLPLLLFPYNSSTLDIDEYYTEYQLPWDFYGKGNSENMAKVIIQAVVNKSLSIDIRYVSEAPNSQDQIYQKYLVNFLLQQLGMSATVSLNAYRRSSNLVLILADTPSSFGKALRSIGSNEQDFAGFFFVHLTLPMSDELMSQIFKESFEQQVVHIMLFFPFGNGLQVTTYSYSPFTEKACFDSKPELVCVNAKEQCDFRPKRLTNFFRCELVFSVINEPPYLIFNNKSNSFINGIEGEIVNALAKKLNFKPKFVTLENSAKSNRTETFNSGSSDVSVGRLRTTTMRRRNVSPSMDYYKSDLVVVTRSGTSLYSLGRLLKPCSTEIWLLYVFLMLAAYVLVIIVQRKFPAARNFILGAGNRLPTYWIWVSSFGGPVGYNPRRNFARFMLLQWITIHFFLRAGYQSFFFKSIQENWKATPVSSIDELLDQHYEIWASLENKKTLSEISNLERAITVLQGTELEALQLLERLDAKVAVVVPSEMLHYYELKRQISKSKLFLIKEPLLEQMLCMHFKRNSYLKQPFDSVLMDLRQSGLLVHWMKMYLPVKSGATIPDATAKAEISLDDLWGALQVFALGICCSFIVLGAELLSLRVQFLRRIFN